MNDETFTQTHKKCDKQLTLSNNGFKKFILDLKDELGEVGNISEEEAKPTQALLTDSESETSDDDELNVNTDGEEEEGTLAISESADERSVDLDRTKFVARVAKASEEAEASEVAAAVAQLIQSGELEKEKETEKEKEKEVVEVEKEAEVQEKEKEKEKEKVPRKKVVRRKTGEGIKKQAEAWEKDTSAEAVSRKQFLEGIYIKYNVLTKANASLQEDFIQLQRQQHQARAAREEAEMSRAALQAKEKELAHSQGKVATLEARLAFALEQLESSRQETKEVKEKLLRSEAEKVEMKKEYERQERQRLVKGFRASEIHIPTENGQVCGPVWSFDIASGEDRDCHSFYGKTCLHLSMIKAGDEMELKGFKWRKRHPERQEEPEAQRARFSP